MHQFNLVNEHNHVTPNYSLDGKTMYFDIFVSPNQDVCVFGKFDPNYIGWCSLTTVQDTKTNAEMFDQIEN